MKNLVFEREREKQVRVRTLVSEKVKLECGEVD